MDKKITAPKKHEQKKLGAFGFIKKYPGFLIALAVAILILLTLAFVQYDPTVSQEKIAYAQQLYQNNESYLNTYLFTVNDGLSQEQSSTLDESYLSSTKSDILWMIDKENALYNSRPSTDVFAKEAAFTLFAQKIILINSEYSSSSDTGDYDSVISQGLAINYQVPEILTQDELDQTFATDAEKEIYSDTLNRLFSDYISSKKQQIQNITSKERQYVEAKKLVQLSTDDTPTADENTADNTDLNYDYSDTNGN